MKMASQWHSINRIACRWDVLVGAYNANANSAGVVAQPRPPAVGVLGEGWPIWPVTPGRQYDRVVGKES